MVSDDSGDEDEDAYDKEFPEDEFDVDENGMTKKEIATVEEKAALEEAADAAVRIRNNKKLFRYVCLSHLLLALLG